MWAGAWPGHRLSVRDRGKRNACLRKSGGDVLRDTGHAGLETLRATDEVALAELAAGTADRGIDRALVALRQAGDLVAALAQLALDLRAGPLDLTLELVAGGDAATLELAHVHVGLALDLLDLARGGGALRVRLDRLDDVVAGRQRGADTREDDALDLLSGGLDGGHLRAAGLLGGASGLSGGRPRVPPRAAGGGVWFGGAPPPPGGPPGGGGGGGRAPARG